MSQEERKQESGPISVTRTVLDGLAAVRKSGLTNMLDVPRVAEQCGLLGYSEAAQWVRTNEGEYSQGVFRGFRAAGD
jgi:hypothetical protein